MTLILICGLPGSGKTTLAKNLIYKLNATWFNADEVRKRFDDWDFSYKGRIRQVKRMKNYAKSEQLYTKYIIIDMVCPTKETRNILQPDIIIWMDTVKKSKYEDTNLLFEPLETIEYDFVITVFNAEYWSTIIAAKILNG